MATYLDSLDFDVALIGTGVAPLAAAAHLIAQNKTVLLLNPDRDFFLEDSELPLEPLFSPNLPRILAAAPSVALDVLRPEFPGAVEFFSLKSVTEPAGFQDPDAPYVRERGCLWISSDRNRSWDWPRLEDFYVEASDQGLNPQIWEGLQVLKRFPGCSSKSGQLKGLYLPRVADMDVSRYRNGLLEFLRERLGPDQLICGAGQFESIPEGLRFQTGGVSKTAKIRQGTLVFWTPRLNQWVASQVKETGASIPHPLGIRLWEQWLLVSRDELDPSVVGMYSDMAVWAEWEGGMRDPKNLKADPIELLSVLRRGALIDLGKAQPGSGESTWASVSSFQSLSSLCHHFLRWDRFSVRSLRSHATLEWNRKDLEREPSDWNLSEEGAPFLRLVPESDGPLVEIVDRARRACRTVLL
jgi:hypothetical protein